MDFLKAKTKIDMDTNSEEKSVAEIKEDKIDAIENDIVSDINENSKTQRPLLKRRRIIKMRKENKCFQ